MRIHIIGSQQDYQYKIGGLNAKMTEYLVYNPYDFYSAFFYLAYGSSESSLNKDIKVILLLF